MQEVAMFSTLLSSRPTRNVRGTLVTTLASVFVHAVIITGIAVATIRAAQPEAADENFVLTQLVPERPELTPPPPLQPQTPATAAQSQPRGFTTLPTPDVIPTIIPLDRAGVELRAEDFEPVGIAGGDPKGTGEPDELSSVPFVVPMDVAPKLLNQTEVQTAVAKNYPAMLRDAGIAGKAKVWIRVNEEGKPVSWQLKAGSGFDGLDSAAMRVAPTMKFTPAMSQLKPIPVWISIDIVFRVK
jgi:TonB family protein